MEYLNEPVDDTLFERLRAFFLNFNDPEMYDAMSISDFMKNKSQIKPTKNFFPFNTYFNGYALVCFSFLVYHSQSSEKGSVSDMGESLEVRLDWTLGGGVKMPDEVREELTEGVRLYDPVVGYSPSDGVSILLDWHLHGPPTEDYGEQKSISSIGGLLPA